MDGLNRVTLLGNLGADPELRMTGGGQAVLKLRLATTESYLDKNQERQERTEWHSCVVWGKRADGLNKILRKGDRVYLEGGLRTSTYDKDGEKRYRTEIVVSEVILCGGKPAPSRGRNEHAEPDRPGVPPSLEDDDIPF